VSATVPVTETQAALDHIQEMVVEAAIALVGAVVVGGVVWAAASWAWWRWWFGDNSAARRVHLRRKELSEAFGTTFTRVRRDGRMAIAPRDTKRFKREGFCDELAQEINTPVTVRIHGGFLEFRTPVAVPDVVKGDYAFDAYQGTMTIGVDKDTGSPAVVSLKEQSAVIVGAMPGSGKTVLLDGITSALRGDAQVVEFDGKLDDPAEFTAMLTNVRSEMEERLRRKRDYWNTPPGVRPDLLLVVIDEAQRLFSAETSTKKDKDAASDRERLVHDLVARGRSAGVLVILASQRLVVTALPSSIRDLAGVRIAGRVARPEDAELVLGVRPGADDPTPVGARRGEFIICDEQGDTLRVQAFAPASAPHPRG